MSPAETPKSDRPSWREGFAVYLKPRVLIVLFLGFSAGLPLALSGATLSVWMTEVNVDIGTIGLFGMVGTPYAIKFLWAPVIDAIEVPILTPLLGRRRGWLVLSQLMLMLSIALLAFSNPQYTPLIVVALVALLVATASATQDILIDAFRIESLDAKEQAAGMASYVAAYRIGMLVSTAGTLYIVSGFEWLGVGKGTAWSLGYAAMAAMVIVGLVTTLLATEPERSRVSVRDWDAQRAKIQVETRTASRLSQTWRAAANAALRTKIGNASYSAFADLLTRDAAVAVLIFIVLYKLCDAFAGALIAPFVVRELGFDRTDYANIVKGVGLAATLVGGFAGGFVARAYSLVACLWLGAFLQMMSNLVFTWLAYVGMNYWALTAAMTVENFTGAIGTVIFVAYLSALCQSPLHTATQYALLTALAAVGRIYLSAGSGYIQKETGWPMFFVLSALTALPSLALLWWLQSRRHFERLESNKSITANE